MRGLGRRLAGAVLLSLLAGVGAMAQLPQTPPARPDPLTGKSPPAPAPTTREQMAELALLLAGRNDKDKEREKEVAAAEDISSERARLQAQLRDLISRLDRPLSSVPPTPPSIVPKSPSATTIPENSKPVDSIREGMNWFRDNDFEAARSVFLKIDQTLIPREDRAFVQYMIACCQRRLNKPNEAARLYRDIADAHDDDFIAECAIWQLSLMRTTQELEGQLEQIRSRAKIR